jgi:hypothetical protein
MTRMGSSKVQQTIFLAITVCLVCLPAYAKYSGDTGGPNDPYRITTAEDLILLGDSPEDYDKHFIMTANIDLDSKLPDRKVFDRAIITSDTNDVDPGFQGSPFTDIFDGNGHTITHLVITGDSYLGLFYRLEEEAAIKNLGLESVDVNGIGIYIVGLVGHNRGSIRKSYSTGMISGDNYIGGLVGSNVGNIAISYSAGDIRGRWFVGGLVGANVGRINSSFWAINTSGKTTNNGGIGKTKDEMQTAGTFFSSGWDFVDETENGTDEIRWILEGRATRGFDGSGFLKIDLHWFSFGRSGNFKQNCFLIKK